MKLDVSAVDYLTGTMTGGDTPAAIGKKFDQAGTPLHDPGCTVICHVPRPSDAFDALVKAQDRLKAGPFADGFAFLPPASFHMTVFDVFIESGRHRERIPTWLGMDAGVAAITEDVLASLENLPVEQDFAIRPTGIFAGFSVAVTGLDAGKEAQLRDTRDSLSNATTIRRADHDTYPFHITLAYNLRWFTRQEAEAICELSAEVAEDLIREMPSLTLGPLEFCRFETMHHFEPIRSLTTGPSACRLSSS